MVTNSGPLYSRTMASACLDPRSVQQCHQVTPGPPGRQRRQTGSTNRWRLERLLVGDLLGQAQVQKAVSLGHASMRSAGTLRIREVTSSRDPPLMRQAAPAKTTGLCSGTLSSPEHSLYLLSQEVTQNAKPDAVLESSGSIWELHCPFLSRSQTLAKLYLNCKKQRNIVLQSRAGSSRTETSSEWSGRWGQMLREDGGMGTSRGRLRRPVLLQLPIRDPSITKDALSFALRTLYRPAERPEQWEGAVLSVATLLGLPQLYHRILLHAPPPRSLQQLWDALQSAWLQIPVTTYQDLIESPTLSFALRTLYRPAERPEQWEGAVLSVATLLGLPQLYHRCLSEMMANISSSTVCDFHRVACKYKQTALQSVCERWLELFLVTELSCQTGLGDLPYDLLLKTLQCPRVFALSEYDLLKTVLRWIYLQLNATERTPPSHRAVTSFFCRAPEVFLEQPQGHMYVPLFQALHLHGITERHHVEEMQKINVFPHSWLLLTFSNHYYSIHNGGDMHVTDFSKHSIRFGMIVDGELPQYTRAVGLYGFYFLLKASRVGQTEAFDFSMERLRHWDPALTDSCRTTQPFSVRAERCVCYQVRVQSCVRGEWQESCSGELSQTFGLSKRCCRSQVFTVDGLSPPLFVTFALAFPSS